MNFFKKQLKSYASQAARIPLILMLLVCVVMQSQNIAVADTSTTASTPLPQSEVIALDEYPNEVTTTAAGACSGGLGGNTTTLTGSGSEQQAYNFFLGLGVNSMLTAAVIGNFMAESHLDPEINQETQTDTATPEPTGPGEGWGIDQWTPGTRAYEYQTMYMVPGNIDLLSTQLNIVWDEMKGEAPTGEQHVITNMQQMFGSSVSNLDAATVYFQQYYESGAGSSAREQFAQDALMMYGSDTASTGSGGATTTAATGCGVDSASVSPECTSATGDEKILCAAEKYDPVSYSETYTAGHQGGAAWHQTCPVINASCYLDCSGLVNIAIYDAFGVSLTDNTYSEVNDPDFVSIPESQAKPGDLMQPYPSHVVIIDHIANNKIYEFAANNGNLAQPAQVGPDSYPIQAGYVYLHYIGPGSQ